ncbi:MAG TPA: hypothetical protein VMX14_13405 [Anaerolineae bacterium]|nr:hypothetical protein [Anaerolineae bacterium]
MAVGSGTGTPVSGAGSATLSSLRLRIRTALENASGFTEPLVVTASSATLTTLRDRVETYLQDSTNLRWATTDLDEAITQAVDQYSRQNPFAALTTITLSANGREIDISTITGLLRVEQVWWDYDVSTPGYPPNYRQFKVWPGAILYIDDPLEPQSGDVVRIWYNKRHTLNLLDSATATTIPDEDLSFLVTGAAHFAALSRAIELSESMTTDHDVVKRLHEWADNAGKNFRYGMGQKPPAWQRYAYAYAQDDIDEALRWAIQRYSEVNPDRTETSLTLAADGREVDTSSITDYVQIYRVWWNYNSSAPAYPPDWRNFEQWPGNILFIKDGDEPQSGDVVRVFYTRLHSLDGLDSASATTIPDDAESLIVTGACGYVAQEREQEQPGRSTPTKLREWAEARLREFERGLRALGRRQASRHSGIAVGPTLDRWDGDTGGWA